MNLKKLEHGLWESEEYRVRLRYYLQGSDKVIWLTIKRLDEKPCHNWSDFQKIKNEIVGPEMEAFEIYPAESRLVDVGNAYHLWLYTDGRIPVGFKYRKVKGEKPCQT